MVQTKSRYGIDAKTSDPQIVLASLNSGPEAESSYTAKNIFPPIKFKSEI
jgi:hypothetical protein